MNDKKEFGWQFRFKVGQEVMWEGGWGSQSAKRAVIKGIEMVERGAKEGVAVPEGQWVNRHHYVVTLENGHWAYGLQISPIRE